MKLKPFISGRFLMALSAIVLAFSLLSWNFKQSTGRYQQKRQATDTVPKEKNKDREKKIRDLDDALDELDRVDLKMNMGKIQKEVEDAIKKIDKDKIKLEIDKAIQEIDVAKIKKQVEESLAKIDWDKIKDELEEVKKINTDNLQDQMKEVEKQMEKIGPQIKKEMEKAKVQVEKAKAELKDYKEFVNGLDKDGLINKKEEYTIKHKNGELTVNGKKVPTEVYSKYRNFLEKHKTFTIEKSDDDFNIDLDDDKD
jgi:hypothetical protein